MSLLELEDVTHWNLDGRSRVRSLERVSIFIEEGDFVGIWGRRRCGKSMLLRIMSGIERPRQGDVRFSGQRLWALSPMARARLRAQSGIAYVPGRLPAPVSTGSSLDEVAVGALCTGASLRQARLCSEAALERIDGRDLADLPLECLSAAERLRVAIAGALVRSPRLLVVDAPELLVHAVERFRIFSLIAGLRSEGGLAIVLAAEELDALCECNRCFTLGDGRLRAVADRGSVVALPTKRLA